ncbi:hypothetical protein RPHASCH2410_PC00875 (plasmid) [Rhizobium phaseoli Ch24-10]|nr:hypothetical protein RPHASCH2410_PC00875 [Rhizobium phaseoli Ch24-10]
MIPTPSCRMMRRRPPAAPCSRDISKTVVFRPFRHRSPLARVCQCGRSVAYLGWRFESGGPLFDT